MPLSYYTIDDMSLPRKRLFRKGWTVQHFDTLEEACFSGVENTVYDGLDDHQNFRSVRRRHRTEDFIAITMDNQVIWLRSRTNHMLEPPRVMEKWTIPAEAKYLYIGSANTADPAFRHRFLFDTDEQNLHRRLLRMAKHCESFHFLKISTAYAHTAKYQFCAVYYPGDEISAEDQAVIDVLNAFPKDDPVAFYDERITIREPLRPAAARRRFPAAATVEPADCILTSAACKAATGVKPIL